MKISKLYGRHKLETVYIVGSGPTLRFFPSAFLAGKVTIGLNQAWRSIPFNLSYNLSIHPNECVPKDWEMRQQTWVTKKKDWLRNKTNDSIYWFDNNKDVKNFEYLTSDSDHLYVGRGIHTAALSLAFKMGARIAVLIGCDFGEVCGQHHATEQTVRFHGLHPKAVYDEYYMNFLEVRKRLHDSMDVLCLTPFIGLDRHDQEFQAMLQLLDKKPLNTPKDDSTYWRKSVDFM